MTRRKVRDEDAAVGAGRIFEAEERGEGAVEKDKAFETGLDGREIQVRARGNRGQFAAPSD